MFQIDKTEIEGGWCAEPEMKLNRTCRGTQIDPNL